LITTPAEEGGAA